MEAGAVPLWRKELSGVVISLERVKASPALVLKVWHGGETVYSSKPFFTQRSFTVDETWWLRVAEELERRGVAALKLLKPDEWSRLLEEIKQYVPEGAIMPRLEEAGLAPTRASISDLARRADKYLGKAVEVDCIVTGCSAIQLAPVALLVTKVGGGKGGEEKKEESEGVLVFDLRDPQGGLDLALKRVGVEKGVRLKPVDRTSMFVLRLQDEETGEDFYAYALGVEPTKSRRVVVRGVVVELGFRDGCRPVLLTTEVEPRNEVVERFEVTPEVLKEIKPLKPSSYEDLLEKLDMVIAPEIVGRRLEKLALALTWCSTLEMKVGDRTEHGLLWTLFFGDTATGKSQTARFMPEELGLGEFVSAETASRAGLLYTVETSIEPPIIIWGRLVLADGEAAALDGLDRLPSSEWLELREARSSGRVVVSRRVKGEAPFRVRIVACANPARKMILYAAPVEAVKEIPVFFGRDAGAGMRRFDLFIPFSEDDVPYDEVADAVLRSRRNLELMDRFKKLVLCSWKATAVFSDAALPRLNGLAKRLLAYARALDIPVVHNAYTAVILKVAAAFACLLQKFTVDSDGVKAVVDEEVCSYVERFFEEYVDRLGLEDYARTLSQAVKADEVVEKLREVEEDPLLCKALAVLYPGKQSKDSLGRKLGIRGHDRQQRLVARLVELGLANAKRGKGIILTSLGRAVAARVIQDYQELDSGGRVETLYNVPGGSSSSCVDSPDANPVSLEYNTVISPDGEKHFRRAEEDSPNSHGTIHTGLFLEGGPPGKEETPLQELDNKNVERPVEKPAEAAEGEDREMKVYLCYIDLANEVKGSPAGITVDELKRVLAVKGWSEDVVGSAVEFGVNLGKLKAEGGVVSWRSGGGDARAGG